VLDTGCIVCHNALEWAGRPAPLRTPGARMQGQGKDSSQKEGTGNAIESASCQMEITRDEWLRRA